jgi:hypothetical protein
MVQLRNTMFLKSPLDLGAELQRVADVDERAVGHEHVLVDRRTPRAKLALATIASSRDSMRQLAIRTFLQQSGSIPSEYPFRIVTPTISTLSQPED